MDDGCCTRFYESVMKCVRVITLLGNIALHGKWPLRGFLRYRPVLRDYNTGTITTAKDGHIPYFITTRTGTEFLDSFLLMYVSSHRKKRKNKKLSSRALFLAAYLKVTPVTACFAFSLKVGRHCKKSSTDFYIVSFTTFYPCPQFVISNLRHSSAHYTFWPRAFVLK